MKLVAYLRVSTDRQAEEGLGLDVQEQAIRKWAKAQGHRVVGWYRDEGVSGSNGIEDRDALPDALEALRDADGLVVYSLDRLARTLTTQEGILGHIWDAEARVFSVTDGGEILEDDPDDPMRTAMRQMRGVFSQLERAMISKRMREGRRRKGEQGGFAYGSPPFGYRSKEGKLVKDPEEQKALDLMRSMREEGASLREIGRALEAEGFRPRQARRPGKRRQTGEGSSGKWHPKVIAEILHRDSA